MTDELTRRILDRSAVVAVVGLGYVGLPLGLALSRHFQVIGFDSNAKRRRELIVGCDITRERLGDGRVICSKL